MAQVSIDKRGHRFLFLYKHGSEDEVRDALAGLCALPRSGFDWCDAAVVGRQMSLSYIHHDLDKRMKQELDDGNE